MRILAKSVPGQAAGPAATLAGPRRARKSLPRAGAGVASGHDHASGSPGRRPAVREVITDVDRVGVSFGVIVAGQAAVSVRGQPVRALGPGDYFGEMALIEDSHRYRSAKITAATELHCLLFAKSDFRPFAMDHPQTAWALLEMMVRRVWEAENR